MSLFVADLPLPNADARDGEGRDSGRVGCICLRRHDYLVETNESGYRVEQ